MPKTVKQLFDSANCIISGRVKWGEPVGCQEAGVYVVSLSNNAEVFTTLNDAPLSQKAISDWIDYVPSMLIDGAPPSVGKLTDRLGKFWIPDECIVYIGQTGSSLRKRIQQYYRTKLGNRSPHAGGHWLKTLSIINELTVYWSAAENTEASFLEKELLEIFSQNVSVESRRNLYDQKCVLPFANRKHPTAGIKNHDITNQVNR